MPRLKFAVAEMESLFYATPKCQYPFLRKANAKNSTAAGGGEELTNGVFKFAAQKREENGSLSCSG